MYDSQQTNTMNEYETKWAQNKTKEANAYSTWKSKPASRETATNVQ